MISDKVTRKIHYMNYYRLEKLANWLTNRYWKKEKPEIAHYIIVYHYHLEEGMAGLLWRNT